MQIVSGRLGKTSIACGREQNTRPCGATLFSVTYFSNGAIENVTINADVKNSCFSFVGLGTFPIFDNSTNIELRNIDINFEGVVIINWGVRNNVNEFCCR